MTPRRYTALILTLLCFAALLPVGCAKKPSESAAAPPVAAPALPDRKGKPLVAKVNNVPLTAEALDAMISELPDAPPPASETVEERRKRALDSLVLLELAYQRALALGIRADEVMVQTGLENLKLNMGGEREFSEYLSQKNMTEADARRDVERRLTINLIYTREVVDRVLVPEDELKREYEREKQRFVQREKTAVIDVYLLQDEGEASMKKARELLAAIKADPKQDPWKLVLDGTFMVRNLAVGREKHKELYDAARKLKPHGLSGVVRTPTGPHIIKLKEYSPERQLTLDEAKPALIAKLNGPYLEKRTREWEEELKTGAQIVLHDAAAAEPRKRNP